VEVAARAAGDHADGVRFVDLAPLRDPALVVPTVARALGVREAGGGLSARDALVKYLSEKRLLIVLDNCEHLLEAAPDVGNLLGACPNLWVLATSRAALRVTGEQEYPVAPLAMPDVGRLPEVGALLGYGAIRLFVERVRAIRLDFALTDRDSEAVVEICRRLDGLPLAIELAAARHKLFAPRELLARLDRRLPLLSDGPRDAPERQRTLRATLDWSYRLLEPAAQAVLRRVAVFVGGGTVGAYEAVCAEPLSGAAGGPGTDAAPGWSPTATGRDRAVDALAALQNACLVELRPGGDGETRVVLLETVREYALEHLAESGVEATIRQRHAGYFLELAGRPIPDDGGGNTEVSFWLDHLQAELGNFRAAADWFLARGDATSALRLGIALHPLWNWRADPSEGRRWLERALAAAEEGGTGVDAGLHVQAFASLAAFASRQTDFTATLAAYERGVALARSMGDWRVLAPLLFEYGQRIRTGLFLDQAERCMEEARALYAEHGDIVQTAACDCYLGAVARSAGDLARARMVLERGLSAMRGLAEPPPAWLNFFDWNLGNVACDEGDHEQARAWHRANVARAIRMRRQSWYGATLLACALWAARTDQPGPATRLLAAATALREAIYHPWPPVDRADLDEAAARISAALSQDERRQLEAEGRLMTTTAERALEYALDVLDSWRSPSEQKRTGGALGGPTLTRRQREVAVLVAEGMTNREIAERLVITERTAENHVEHVLSRLGLRSRAQIAAWVVGQRNSRGADARAEEQPPEA
jgi:non-specific serine/threonine protein kinase